MKEFIMYFFAFSLTLASTMILLNLYRAFFGKINNTKPKVKRAKKKTVDKNLRTNNTYQKPVYNYTPYSEKKCVGYDGSSPSFQNRFTYEEYSRKNRISR